MTTTHEITTETITHQIEDEVVQHIISEETITHIIEAEQGPPGPPGIGADPSSFSYTHIQATASSEWIVNHNLLYNPNVQIEDSAWDLVTPSKIIHDSTTVLRIQFLGAMSWKAYCS